MYRNKKETGKHRSGRTVILFALLLVQRRTKRNSLDRTRHSSAPGGWEGGDGAGEGGREGGGGRLKIMCIAKSENFENLFRFIASLHLDQNSVYRCNTLLGLGKYFCKFL